MLHQTSSSNPENTYVVDIESVAEMVRLTQQDRLVTRNMKGPFAERSDFSNIERILDLACGPGSWVLDMAFAHPDIEVIGVDLCQQMVDYAWAQARAQGLYNAQFQVMNVLEPFDFPEETFDVVNARYIYGFMPKDAWLPMLEECRRVLRPGGIIRLTEPEWPISNSPACEQLVAMFTQAMYRAGRSFSPDGRHLGITPMISTFLRLAGFQNIERMAHVLDYSADAEEYSDYTQNLLVAFQLLLPFLLKWETTTREQFDSLCTQARIEMLSEHFCGICFYLTTWGVKPE